jgi:tetratricopeptide (TPR) repeat protein
MGLLLALASIPSRSKASTAQDLQRQTALTLEQQGKIHEAEDAWRVFLKAHPSSSEADAHLGLLEARQEHFKEAVALYRRALALNPAMPGLRLNLGLALFKAGEMKEAIREFNPLLKSQPPASPDAQRLTILIGMAHYGLTEYAEAAPYLKEAAARDAENLPLRMALAHSCLWSKQYQCVLDAYHEILTLNAESAEADMLAGEALDELKDDVGATEMFRDAIKANPNEPNVHFGLGYLLWSHEKYPEAAHEFQAELANDPTHAESMLYLADAYIQMNRTSDAEPLLRKVVKMDSSLELAHLDLGIIASDAGRNQEALQELTRAEQMMPKDVNVHWRLAKLYRAIGKKQEAKAEFDKARTLNNQADEALLTKMASGSAHPPPAQTPPAPPEK